MTRPHHHLDTRRPFTRAEALAAGITPAQLRAARFRRLFRGVYVDAAVAPTPRLRVLGALRLFDDLAWASHASAARLHDLPVPTLPDEHVSVPQPKHRRHHPGVRTHVGDPCHIVVRGGVRVTHELQTFVELAGLLGLVDLVVVGDHLVRRCGVTPERLVAWCAGSRHPAAARARKAAAYVRADVDSPMETRLRMLLVLAGLPEPRVNLTVRAGDGEVLRRHDLSYPEAKVVVEYDGRHHVERVEQWEADLDRREAIDDEAWRILVVVAAGIYRHPERTLRRVHRLLLARGCSGVPTRLSADWRPHFPGHAAAA